MNLVSAIAVFFIIWWTALFAVLPFSLSRDEQGIPRNPNLKKKFLITTIIAIVIWLLIYVLVEVEVISFRDLAASMAEGDL